MRKLLAVLVAATLGLAAAASSSLVPGWQPGADGFEVTPVTADGPDAGPFRHYDATVLSSMAKNWGVTCQRYEGFVFKAVAAGATPWARFSGDSGLYQALVVDGRQPYFVAMSFHLYAFLTTDRGLLGLWSTSYVDDHAYFRVELCGA